MDALPVKKTSERIHGCREGGAAEGWCDRGGSWDRMRWK